MITDELELSDSKYRIKASIKVPDNQYSKNGVILAHGAIVNRQSLIRREKSFADYLSKELDAYIIVPDLEGDTIHKYGKRFDNFVEIFNITSQYFVEKYELENLFGFGHSMGCYVLAESLEKNNMLDGIAMYGGPIKELNSRRIKIMNYLFNYLSDYKYTINVRNLMNHIFDKETCRYFNDIMLKDEMYRSHNYVYDFDTSIYDNIIEIAESYISKIEKWGKPALIIFGTEDKVTEISSKHYKHNMIINNITYKHAKNASHVTPCMNVNFQLQKLSSIVSFFKELLEDNIEKEYSLII